MSDGSDQKEIKIPDTFLRKKTRETPTPKQQRDADQGASNVGFKSPTEREKGGEPKSSNLKKFVYVSVRPWMQLLIKDQAEKRDLKMFQVMNEAFELYCQKHGVKLEDYR